MQAKASSRALIRKFERPVAWGTTGLPWEPAWVWDIEALGCVWEGGPDEAAWGAAGGLSEFLSKSGGVNATDCSTSQTNERLQVSGL